MPIVHGCIVPTAPLGGDDAIAEALRRLAEGLAGYAPELVVVIAPAARGASKIGVFAPDPALADRLVTEAKKGGVPVDRLMRRTIGEPPIAIDAASRALLATCGLDPRLHFGFGRAAARVLDADERRIAIICAVELSKGNERFDAQYRRALAAWDVKSMVNVDVASRHAARERAVAQTALLMGVLGGYRIQPRELAYEPSPSGGYIVLAIDVLGSRKRAS